jgi:alpha,alpha-trehalase
MKLETLVLPLDRSRAALAALPVATALRQLFEATLQVLYVSGGEPPPRDLLGELGLTPRELRGGVLSSVQGDAAEAIVRVARSHPHPAIVMCHCTGEAGDRGALGSVARGVLSAANCPVLLVHPERGVEPWRPTKILLPHDGSSALAAAAKPAAALAFRARAELLVLHVDLPGSRGRASGRLAAPQYVDEPQHEWPTWTREFTERLFAGQAPGEIALRPFAGFGQPEDEVRRYAACLQPDLVVLGWEGRLDAGYGRVLRTVLRDVTSPVLVVPLTAGRIERRAFDAVLFDLDGVITQTAAVHAAAWKRLFDGYLESRSRREGTPFQSFDIDEDYRTYIDGKPRYDGVASFLSSRGIRVPQGTPEDSPEAETVCGLGNRKNRYFQEHLRRHGVAIYETTVEFVRQVRAHGLRTALVSSSKNAAEVLEAAEITTLFDTRVDGVEIARLGLRGKPAPDMFLEAARRLETSPQRAVVVEDAASGIEAGRAGGFGLVVGVDRNGHAEALRRSGAHVIVTDLHQLLLVD